MRSTVICVFALTIVLSLAPSLCGQESTIINAVEGPPPIIDGIVEDVWALSNEHFIATHVADTAPDNDADCSGSWWVLMDAEYLYILVDVNDETLTQDNAIGDAWQDDSVEIYIDGDNSKGASTDGVNDYQYRVRWNDEVEWVTEYFLSPGSLEGVEYAVATTIDGYLFEVKLPWATMTGGLPPAGQLLGIDVWINDDDDGGGRDTQMAWSGIDGAGWNMPSQWGTAQLTPPVTAFNPSPANGAEGVTAPLLQWTPGRGAATHNLYFGTNPTPGEAEFIGPQTWTVYWAGALVPGTTYYWRVDEIEADEVTMHPGSVWSFTVMPVIAWKPNPPDGSDGVMVDAKLNWLAGQASPPLKYTVYFGENFDDVNEGTAGTNRGTIELITTFDPGALKADTYYYWRIDEVQMDSTIQRGDVWTFATIESGPGRIVREWWFDVFGTAVANLTLDPRYPDNPDGWEFVDLFEGPVNWSDNYGSRLRGWLFPPATGDYVFWVAGDDETQLWLSADEDPAKKAMIASVPGWVPSRDFDNTGGGAGGPSQRSTPRSLVAGQRYYIEAIMKDGTGGDNIAVAWQGPGIAVRDVISAEYVGATPFLPEVAYAPAPADGSSGVPDMVTLTWQPGVKAAQHEVYFGTDQDAVAAADTTTTGIYRGLLSATSYVPTESPLEWGRTYYWKINEKNNDGTMMLGKVWSFTTADYIVIDDFEDYNDYSPDRIFQTWIDGFGYTDPPPGKTGNGTGSTVGYLTAPFAEQTTVHGGGQSMPYGFDLTAFPFYAEAEREFTFAQNFSRKGVKSISLWVYGDPNSAPAQLYVGLQDSAGTRIDVPDTITSRVQRTSWQEVYFDLSEFAPVSLTSIKKMYIGVGNRLSPSVGGTGNLFVDDIRLYRPRCVASLLKPANDLNDDCVVDYLDLDIVVNEWLTSGHMITPVAPSTAGLVAHYQFEGNTNDSAGANNGTPNGGPTYAPGKVGQAINLDGVDDYVSTGKSASALGIGGNNPRTVTSWVFTRSFGNGAIYDVGNRDTAQDFCLRTLDNVNNRWRIQYWGGDYDFSYDTNGKWVHFGHVHDGTNTKIYADGQLIVNWVKTIDTTDDNPFQIGCYGWLEFYFDGLVDDVRVYSRALSQAEVAWLAGKTVPFSAPFDFNADDAVDFGDFTILSDSWLDELLWPAP